MGIENDTHIYFVFGRVEQTKSTTRNRIVLWLLNSYILFHRLLYGYGNCNGSTYHCERSD